MYLLAVHQPSCGCGGEVKAYCTSADRSALCATVRVATADIYVSHEAQHQVDSR
jgi:hypothetical protein